MKREDAVAYLLRHGSFLDRPSEPWLENLPGKVGAGEVLLRLVEAERFRAEGPKNTPPLVMLLGGSGVGKSLLFNALAGADVSRSFGVRPTTRGAGIYAPATWWAELLAIEEELGALLLFPALRRRVFERPPEHAVTSGPDESVVLLHTRAANTAPILIDVPDVDSTEEENHRTVRRILDACDAVLYVNDEERFYSVEVRPFLEAARILELECLWVYNDAEGHYPRIAQAPARRPTGPVTAALVLRERLRHLGFQDDSRREIEQACDRCRFSGVYVLPAVPFDARTISSADDAERARMETVRLGWTHHPDFLALREALASLRPPSRRPAAREEARRLAGRLTDHGRARRDRLNEVDGRFRLAQRRVQETLAPLRLRPGRELLDRLPRPARGIWKHLDPDLGKWISRVWFPRAVSTARAASRGDLLVQENRKALLDPHAEALAAFHREVIGLLRDSQLYDDFRGIVPDPPPEWEPDLTGAQESLLTLERQVEDLLRAKPGALDKLAILGYDWGVKGVGLVLLLLDLMVFPGTGTALGVGAAWVTAKLLGLDDLAAGRLVKQYEVCAASIRDLLAEAARDHAAALLAPYRERVPSEALLEALASL